jgi:glucose/arabinose dehydrogenase
MSRRISFARTTTAVAIVIASILSVSGCAAAPDATPPTTAAAPPVSAPMVPVTETASAPAPAAVAAATGPVSLANLKLGLVRKWGGLTHPLYLTNAGDGSGRIFIVEQRGLIKVVVGGTMRSKPFLDLRSKTVAGGERGLLGLAFSPKYKTDGRVYVNYTDKSGNTVVARYTAPTPSSSTPKWGTPKRLLYIKQPYPNHNGGCLQFGPDGYLYIGMGDGGSAGDPGNRAQHRGVLLGKMLRINPAKAGATKPYLIPPTNPSRLTKSASLRPRSEVWALGVRNPWRFSFDSSTGTLWLADVGQDAFEEVNYVSRSKAASRMDNGGLNFGWRKFEGLHYYPSGATVPKAKRSSKYVWPTINFSHPNAESITGGYVYRGQDYPAMVGTYIFGDYEKGWIGGIRTRAPSGAALATREARTLMQTPYFISSFGVDERGELYLVHYDGTVFRVTGVPK